MVPAALDKRSVVSNPDANCFRDGSRKPADVAQTPELKTSKLHKKAIKNKNTG